MKVLGLSGSMRKDGNTAALIKVILDRCEGEGIKTEFVSLAGKRILPCLGCEKCKEKRCCVIENDDWSDMPIKFSIAMCLLSVHQPITYDVCGHLKNFIDRTYSLYHDRKLAGRKGIAVAVQAQKGANRTIQTLEGFLGHTNFHHWDSLKGQDIEEGRFSKIRMQYQKPRKSEIRSSVLSNVITIDPTGLRISSLAFFRSLSQYRS